MDCFSFEQANKIEKSENTIFEIFSNRYDNPIRDFINSNQYKNKQAI